jgi:acyl-CoA hydrolase
MEPQPASASRSALVRWMGIQDANHGGFVHGGTVMKLCDEAAGLAAVGHARRRVVTAGRDRKPEMWIRRNDGYEDPAATANG